MAQSRCFPRRDLAVNAPPSDPTKTEKLLVFSPKLKRYYRFDGANFRDCVNEYAAYKEREYDRKARVPDFQEVVFSSRWHRLMFDLDLDIDPDETNAYEESIAWLRDVIHEVIFTSMDVYFDMFDDVITESDFLVCESLDAREPFRLSAHITIRRQIPNHKISAHFADLVIAGLPEEMRIIDRSLYSAQHNLRIAGCAKDGSCRIKMPPPGIDLLDTFAGAPCVRISEANVDKWAPLSTARADTSSLIAIASTRLVRRACELIDAKYGAGKHVLRKQAGNLLSFRRIVPSFCAFCNRTHDHDNTVLVQISSQFGMVQYKELCRRYLEEHRRDSSGSSDAGSTILGTTASDDGIDSAIKAKEPQPRGTMESRIPTESYTDCLMHDYPIEPRTLFIRAPMKLGKTKALRRFVTNHITDDTARIIFVSFRRTFSAAVAQSFSEFALYTNIRGALDTNKMIVQVESLHRIVPDKLGRVDLLILDESESIIDQFDSGLSSERGRDFAVFQWLLRTAKRCIALDAFMSERTYAVIGRIRGIDGALLIKNEFKNAIDEQFYFASSHEQWLLALQECVRNKEKVVICANSATEGGTLCEMLRRKLAFAVPSGADGATGSGSRIKFYCAETAAHIKARDFDDVNACWTDCEVLIYTPTLTAGVSFEREHFDRMFGYFTDRSCSAQVCIQMMGRIRNIAKHQSFICLQTNPGSLPETREDMLLYLRIKKGAIMSPNGVPDIEFTEEGLPTIPDTDYAELRVQNALVRNRSRNDFTRELIRLIAESGAKCERLSLETHLHLFGKTPSRDDFLRMREEHHEIKGEITLNRAQMIATSRELTGEEFKEISETIAAQRDSDLISIEDRAAVKKFELRMTYGKQGEEIGPDFVMTFLDPQLMHAFKNLSLLCEYLARNERDITRALCDMRATEAAHMRSALSVMPSDGPSEESPTDVQDVDFEKTSREFDFAYVYETHRLAHVAVTILGFTSVLDKTMRPMREVEHLAGCSLPRITKLLTLMRGQFKIQPAIARSPITAQTFIGLVKTILEETYGIYLIYAGDLYHLVLSKNFRILPNGKLTTVGP